MADERAHKNTQTLHDHALIALQKKQKTFFLLKNQVFPSLELGYFE